ncbi:MAG TPA: hypothetical protein VGE07_23590 [Herpetosiphonaceae bacterium]
MSGRDRNIHLSFRVTAALDALVDSQGDDRTAVGTALVILGLHAAGVDISSVSRELFGALGRDVSEGIADAARAVLQGGGAQPAATRRTNGAQTAHEWRTPPEAPPAAPEPAGDLTGGMDDFMADV